MPIFGVVERLRNAARIQQVLRVAIRFGFAQVVEQVERVPRGWLHRLRRGGAAPDPAVARLAEPERLRRMLEALGPTFIKVGQLLSTRRDLLPDWAVKELRKLQDKVAPMPFEQVREVLEAELGGSLGTVFSEFEREPLAAASLAQVHRAVLPDGSRVAVKVQRPGIVRTVERDLSVLADLARLVEGRLGLVQHLRLTTLVDELAHTLRDELLYTIEARNAERQAATLKPGDGLRAPRVWSNLTTARVLVCELFEGTPLSAAEQIDPELRRELAGRLAAGLLRQILLDGFFHADPHPGNLILLADGTLGLVDWGMVGHLPRRLRDSLDEVFLAIMTQDVERLVDEITELGLVDEAADLERFRRDLSRALDRYLLLSRRDFPLRQVLHTILELSYEHKIQLPSEIPLLVKVLVTCEGTCLELDEAFELRAAFQPVVDQIVGSRLDPARLARDLTTTLRGFARAGTDLPRQVHSILGKLEAGRVSVRTENAGLNAALGGIQRLLGQLASSLLCAAVLVAAGLVYPVNHTLGYTLLTIGGASASVLLLAMYRGTRDGSLG
ncbi:MAG: AarF/ABC1/UbiB kinase family protein [Fimbriimonadaceae bacterium]|nr:AarF/ABC1/UbiB kinase family protein [Fimbriimonadaceae bacterium]